MLRQWPGVSGEVTPQHADLRLYGAAAFERCLQVRPGPVHRCARDACYHGSFGRAWTGCSLGIRSCVWWRRCFACFVQFSEVL